MRCGVSGSVATAVFLCVTPAPSAAQAQGNDSLAVLSGVVVSGAAPLALAEVLFVNAPHATLTDSTGRYLLRDIVPGRYVLIVRRIGYAPVAVEVTLSRGRKLMGPISLTPSGQPLPDVVTIARQARPERYATTAKYDDALRRRRAGHGTFIGREEFERRAPLSVAEILHGVPGVRVSLGTGTGAAMIRFTRCSGAGDRAAVYVDGVRQIPQRGLRGPEEVGEILSRYTPGQIEMVEVFRGVAQIPGEFLEDACAVIALWTR